MHSVTFLYVRKADGGNRTLATLTTKSCSAPAAGVSFCKDSMTVSERDKISVKKS
jgi:hypothetical protein